MWTQSRFKYLIIFLILLLALTTCRSHQLGELVTPVSSTISLTTDSIEVTLASTVVPPTNTAIPTIVTQSHTVTPTIASPPPPPTPQTTITPIINRNPDAEWVEYRNDEYGFALQYPADWGVAELSNKIVFTYPGSAVALRFKVKRANEDVNIQRTDMPAGRLVERDSVTFIGEPLPTALLVYEEKNKYVLYNNGGVFERGDLLFTIEMGSNRSTYEAGDIPEWMHETADRIVISVRWQN